MSLKKIEQSYRQNFVLNHGTKARHLYLIFILILCSGKNASHLYYGDYEAGNFKLHKNHTMLECFE